MTSNRRKPLTKRRKERDETSSTNRKSPIGIHAYFHMENRDDLKAQLRVDILAVDTRVVGASFDSIKDYMSSNDGELPYIAFQSLVTLQEMLTAFKRFDMVLTLGVGPFSNAFEEGRVNLSSPTE